jgi:hypothetical protein
MLELGAMGVIGAAILVDEFNQSPLCDLDRINNTDAEVAEKIKKVKDAGQRCVNGTLVFDR